MADPQAATLTQLRNIQFKTGKTIAQLHAVLAASGLAKTGERRSLLMEHFKLGYGDANAVALVMDKPLRELGDSAPAPVAGLGDPLDSIYTGAKAALRPLHHAYEPCSQGACASTRCAFPVPPRSTHSCWPGLKRRTSERVDRVEF
jgi:hypothetical protein